MSVRDLIPQNWAWWRKGEGREPTRWSEDAREPLVNFHREVNRLFDDFFHAFESRRPWFGGGGWPTVEIDESDREIVVTAELPGMEEKDVEVLLEQGMLTLRGEKSTTDDRHRQFSERFYGRFERRLPLPVEIDEDKVEASFRNGLLRITLPKAESARSQVRRITLKS